MVEDRPVAALELSLMDANSSGGNEIQRLIRCPDPGTSARMGTCGETAEVS